MPKFRYGLLTCASILVIIGAFAWTAGADEKLSVPNTGFEEKGADGLPASWKLETRPAAGSEVALDDAVKHSGGASLMIRNAAPGSVTLSSEPVALQVGRLYRLSGWVKTEGALSDPTSHYPTAVPACLTMLSFPFTNHSPAVGATRDWTRVETLFIATKRSDRIKVHFGFNGWAEGKAWFDDLSLEEVDDIGQYIPPETVRRFGPAYRYDDRGWIFVHIEGAPYERGYQYGCLVADEIVEYIRKLAVRENSEHPESGWNAVRFVVQAYFLNRFEEEYQLEMKGVADGAAHAGAQWDGRPPDLIDIAGINSIIDIGQMYSALRRTANATSGIDFLKQEDEILLGEENNKCSALAATGSATDDGRFVFGQIFMWSGYTGVHWDVICDVQPSEGHRLVYQTFPGGLHSGADFYINDAGIVVGETTVSQTPYNDAGTPQSNRIRKAMQYADSIDDVVAILTDRNNGMYTNEWPFADAKTDEVGIFLLGTYKWRLWRSGAGDFPAGDTDFYWCNNNAKDLEVRKEYIVDPNNAPFDLMFRPRNRDVFFQQFYREHKGRIDSIAAVNLWATPPINLAHACDGKITTGDMADRLVFLAHYGKLTLRHKFVGSRWIADLPGAKPHLSLGYSTPSPIFVTDKLKEAKAGLGKSAGDGRPHAPPTELGAVADTYKVDKRELWRFSIYPASTAESWLVSGSAGYWRLLDGLPGEPARAAESLTSSLAELNASLLYLLAHEDDVVPVQAEERFDGYAHYQVPRIKGTYLLHQLRLLLGNETFLRVMARVHSDFREREITTAGFIALAEEVSGRELKPFIAQWIERTGLPDPQVKVAGVESSGDGEWIVKFSVSQEGRPYRLLGSVDVRGAEAVYRRPFEVGGESAEFTVSVPEKPVKAVFNAGFDFPVKMDNFYTLGCFAEDFKHTLVVYGTARQIEANHELALRFQTMLADDGYSELLPPVKKDCEVTEEDLAAHDLMLVGQPFDNAVMQAVGQRYAHIEFGKNHFTWKGMPFNDPDQGMIIVLPNPWNAERIVYLWVANSAMQFYEMGKSWYRGVPSWAIFRGGRVVDAGYDEVRRFVFEGF